MKQIEIPMSEEDLSELLFDRRKEFNWNFDGIDVRIYKE